jgi:septum formation topological specificity factor MinE
MDIYNILDSIINGTIVNNLQIVNLLSTVASTLYSNSLKNLTMADDIFNIINKYLNVNQSLIFQSQVSSNSSAKYVNQISKCKQLIQIL